MIEIYWNPVAHLGPIPINWYGITMMLGFLVGGYLTWKWAPKSGVPRAKIESLIIWILVGALVGARAYFLVQNDFGSYLGEPWRMLAVWEGGLALFGGLFGATLAAFLYTWRHRLQFSQVADLYAPAIPIGAAIGRITCGLAGMDYGTPTQLPWGVIYTNAHSYAPTNDVARHPTQFYELVGDVVIAGILLKLRGKLSDGGLFLLYLILFSVLRFFLFFIRGDVPIVGLGLKNGQWTALVIVVVALLLLMSISLRNWRSTHTT